MKGYVVVLAVFVGLAVAGDFVARKVAERRVAERVQTSLGLDESPIVTIAGWPFLLGALNGTIPKVELSASNVARTNVTLDRVRLRLTDVRFDVSELIRDGGRVRVGGGDGDATISGDALTARLRSEGAPVTVRFVGDRVLVATEGMSEEAAGHLTLGRGSLVVSADGSPETYAVDLPRLGRRVEYRTLHIEDGHARLMLALGAGVLRLDGAVEGTRR